tara:strand:+ start:263 stop:577 length:315 start_codon:yes stop_codon:yes gene_type:complete
LCCIFATVPGGVAFLSHIFRALLNQNKFIMCLIILYDLVSLIMETNQDKQQKEDKMIKKENECQTSLLEDLENLVGDYQRDKVSKKQVIDVLESIVKYERSNND